MELQTEAEKQHIQDLFDTLMNSFSREISEEGRALVTKAFKFANIAHIGVKRKSGEPYIIHPIEVATIVARDIGLGSTATTAAILHDVVEDTNYTVDDMATIFGDKVAYIVDGLTKVKNKSAPDLDQATNFKKMLLTLSEDIRVIFIKLADRLHNMRTLEFMPKHKQLKIAGETLFVYAPLAHRLGLNPIKTELEDLSFKYKHPESYKDLKSKIDNYYDNNRDNIEQFSGPIREKLKSKGVDFEISSRLKTPYSISQTIEEKGVEFDEIFDLVAIRIIFTPKEGETEREGCFGIYSTITEIYSKQKQGKFKDLINAPKSNGYRALHNTLMDNRGNWFSVQIRTSMMNEIADRGVASDSFYNYDKDDSDNKLEGWLDGVKGALNNPDANALEFLDNFKLELYQDEIVVFTPKGDLKSLPKGSTVIDLAYAIHTKLGDNCIGAKVDRKLVTATHILKSGNQVEILTSSKLAASSKWINLVKTSTARHKIKEALSLSRVSSHKEGQEILENILKENDFVISDSIKLLIQHFKMARKSQLYAQIGNSKITKEEIVKYLQSKREKGIFSTIKTGFDNLIGTKPKAEKNSKDTILLVDQEGDIISDYIEADCCSPLPGDEVIGVKSNDIISIHKLTCKHAEKAMANEGNKIVVLNWRENDNVIRLSKLKIVGFDRKGVIKDISEIISSDLNINIRSLKLEAVENTFRGDIHIYVTDNSSLKRLVSQLKSVDGIEAITEVLDN